MGVQKGASATVNMKFEKTKDEDKFEMEASASAKISFKLPNGKSKT